MELGVLMRIDEDKKMHDYLFDHSYWFRYLNRNPKNVEMFIKEYKAFKREANVNKFRNTIDNVDMISSLIKFM